MRPPHAWTGASLMCSIAWTSKPQASCSWASIARRRQQSCRNSSGVRPPRGTSRCAVVAPRLTPSRWTCPFRASMTPHAACAPLGAASTQSRRGPTSRCWRVLAEVARVCCCADRARGAHTRYACTARTWATPSWEMSYTTPIGARARTPCSACDLRGTCCMRPRWHCAFSLERVSEARAACGVPHAHPLECADARARSRARISPSFLTSATTRAPPCA